MKSKGSHGSMYLALRSYGSPLELALFTFSVFGIASESDVVGPGGDLPLLCLFPMATHDKLSVDDDSVVSFQTPLFVLEVSRTLCEKRSNNRQAIATGIKMPHVNSDGGFGGKPSFRLAGVANERTNSGHAQREREALS